jgi:predicted RecA/RadA family phage recombinase
MKNYVQDGNTLALTNSGNTTISSGTPVAVGDLLVVAITDIQPGSTGDGRATGVVALPKLPPM